MYHEDDAENNTTNCNFGIKHEPLGYLFDTEWLKGFLTWTKNWE